MTLATTPGPSFGRISRADWCAIVPAALVICIALAGCGRKEQTSAPGAPSRPPPVVTADIQKGIESYIEHQVRLGSGWFNISFGTQDLHLKLVRVHTEYLANLGPRRHFACVDLADVGGDVYDVDFFLAGDPGAMTVTETTVHKINGQPYYAWEQQKDKTWHRVPAKDASQVLLGVVRDRDKFSFVYRATLPKLVGSARMWLPLAASDMFQAVELTSLSAPGMQTVVVDRTHGNRILVLDLGPEDSRKTIELAYNVQRREKAAYAAPAPSALAHLGPERLVPTNDMFRAIAAKVVEGKNGDLVRARAIYDHVIDRMRYMKYGSGWGKGDAMYACDARTGNCTDFHSYFVALARSVGIPARFAIGAAIPSERNEGGVDGYHCWAEFYAEGKWWPVDISEGNKYSSLATYYFGHHPANRFTFSHGRDLVVVPAPASGPINFLAYPLLETNGAAAKVAVQFLFNRTADQSRRASLLTSDQR